MATAIKAAFGNVDSGINKLTDFTFRCSDTSMRRLHSPPDGTSTFDEVWLWVFSSSSSNWTQIGMGTSSSYNNNGTSQQMYFPSATPPWLILQGWLMQDDEDYLGVQTSQTSYGRWHGYVNRITN
jgi:hypothetical protein